MYEIKEDLNLGHTGRHGMHQPSNQISNCFQFLFTVILLILLRGINYKKNPICLKKTYIKGIFSERIVAYPAPSIESPMI